MVFGRWVTEKLFKISEESYYMGKKSLLMTLDRKLRGGNDYGKIMKIRFIILESEVKKTGNVINEMFPCVLAISKRIMEIYYQKFETKTDNIEILEIKTATYDPKIEGETFAKIIIKIIIKIVRKKEQETEEIEIESYIGKGVGFHDNKKVEIFFEKGSMKVNYNTGVPIIKTDPPVKENGDPINELKNDFCNEFYKEAFLELSCQSNNNGIKEIVSRIKDKVGTPKEYEKFSLPNEILMKFEEPGERYEAFIDVLLHQYNNLRSEITQSIYLEHYAILGLYTFLGLVVVFLIGEGIRQGPNFLDQIHNFYPEKTVFFLSTLILVQIVVNGFGSLFLKEQARNRRACSFLKAIEYLINKKLGGIGIYWENFITSPLIAEKFKKMRYIEFDIPINPQYYKNRLLSVGLPVFLPNFLITLIIGYNWLDSFGKTATISLMLWVSIVSVIMPFFKVRFRWYLLGYMPFVVSFVVCLIFGKGNFTFSIFFMISLALTLFWALMIILKVFSPLKGEEIPSRERVLAWVEEENRNPL